MNTSRKKTLQISLLILGFGLILITYFIYPWLIQKSETVFKDPKIKEMEEIIKGDDQEIQDTSLTNVEYKGLTSEGNPYTIVSEIAQMDKKKPDIVYMEFVTAKFYYKDGRIVIITSDIGQFNKSNGDISFQKNIKMVDNVKNELTSENLDMLISKNYIAAYNDVKLVTGDGQFVIADRILFDSIKKSFKISMHNKDNNIKMKLVK